MATFAAAAASGETWKHLDWISAKTRLQVFPPWKRFSKLNAVYFNFRPKLKTIELCDFDLKSFIWTQMQNKGYVILFVFK